MRDNDLRMRVNWRGKLIVQIKKQRNIPDTTVYWRDAKVEDFSMIQQYLHIKE